MSGFIECEVCNQVTLVPKRIGDYAAENHTVRGYRQVNCSRPGKLNPRSQATALPHSSIASRVSEPANQQA